MKLVKKDIRKIEKAMSNVLLFVARKLGISSPDV